MAKEFSENVWPQEELGYEYRLQQRLDALDKTMRAFARIPEIHFPRRIEGNMVDAWFEDAGQEIERWAESVNKCRADATSALEGR